MPSLVAVIVTYNRLEKLKTCVQAVLAEVCDAVVVVDNCSTDGSSQWLDQMSGTHPKLDVLHAARNLGGAGGFEMGYRHALTHYPCDWLVCFDDDAYPQSGAFQAFHDTPLEGIDAAAAAVYFPDGRICEMNRPGLNPFWRWRQFFRTIMGGGRTGFHLNDSDYQATQPVVIDSTSFVGFFVRRTMVEKVGLPEGRLFIYGDDVLYALSVRRAGGEIRLLPWVTFHHDCATLSTAEKTIKPLWKVYYTYRNGLRVYHAAAGWLFWGYLPLKVVQWLIAARHYAVPRVYLGLLRRALTDAATQNYNRSHSEIVGYAAKADKATKQKSGL